LAHEIRQPLTAGAAYLSAMRQMLTMSANKRPVSIEDTLEKAAKQLEWAAKIVKHLRDFVPDPDALKTLCYLHNLIRQSVELTGLSVKKAQIWLTLRLDATEDLVFVDPVQIKQVLTNMIRNAIEAMQSSEFRKLTISSALIEGRMIQIDVADTGSGISQEVADTMFDANVTTKPEGSGVGLALSRAIIGSHGGTISAPKNKDSGATVSFTLPLAEPK
jgi:two-component system CheB/CheR fusion protein